MLRGRGASVLVILGVLMLLLGVISTAVANENDYLDFSGGQLNGVTLDPDDPQLTVRPGAAITGEVDLLLYTEHRSGAVFPVIGTPTWGDHESSFWTIDSWAPVGTSTYDVTIDLQAPQQPGSYYIGFAGRAEMTGANVASMTNWSVGANSWNDGNDIAEWSSSVHELAIAEGNVLATWDFPDGPRTGHMPATAIRVEATPEPATWILLACTAGMGALARRRREQ